MTRLRRVAIVLMAASLIVAAVYATGAFTTLTAKREANIAVAGDSASFLSLQPAPGPNGEYATLRGGKLRISLAGALKNSKATGINKQAVTGVRNVFTITNHGSQPLGIWITDKSKAVTFKGGTKWKTLEGRGYAVKLRPGKTLYVGLSIDTRKKTGTGGNLIKKMKVHATADVSGATVKTGPSKSAVDRSSTTASSSDSNSNGDNSSSKSKDGGDSKSDSNKGDNSAKSHKDDSSLVENVVKGFKALTLGFTIGNWGMPGGIFTAKESSSPLYLLGQLLNAIAPWGLDMVADLRDILANVASGKTFTWGTALNVVGLLPVLGSLDSASDLRKITQNWMSAFPSQADEVVGFLSNAIIKHLPSSIGAKLLGVVSDAPVSKLTNKGIPVDDIIQYSDEGVDFQRVLELRSKGVSPEDIRYFVDKGANLKQVSNLRSKDIPVSDIQRYVDEGVDLKRVERLRNGGLPPRAVKYVVIKDANPRLINKLQSQDVPVRHILHFFDEGADLKMASKLRSQDVSVRDIRDYVDKDIQLSGVSKMQSMGVPPKVTKSILRIVKSSQKFNNAPKRKEMKILNKEIEGFTVTETILEIAKATVAYNGWKDARQNTQTKNNNDLLDDRFSPSKGKTI
jgi:hypothetical protein